jgi:ATP-dependent protease HslVU (ClpYQ) ATPase subunit
MDLTLKEVKPLIKYIIENNDALEARGIVPVSINLVADAGIGKSSIVEEIAKEFDANYIKLNLSQITETGDIAGFPICLHYACKDDGSDCK